MLRKDKDHLISRAILLQLILDTWCYSSKRAANFSMMFFNNTFTVPQFCKNFRQRRDFFFKGRLNVQSHVRITYEKFLNICFSLVNKLNIFLSNLGSENSVLKILLYFIS